MSSSKLFLSGLLLAGLLVACEPPPVEPELTISVSPRTVDGVAQKATVKVNGLDDKAKQGTGKVRITSTAGSLKDGVEIDMVAGEGTTDFLCARATDVNCVGSVRLNAEWVVNGKLVTASTSLTVAPPVVIVPDAGTTLVSSRTSLGIGLGQSALLTATYSVDGVLTPDAGVMLTTSLGTLLLADGGAFVPQQTDSAGQIHAMLVESGIAGTANVVAAGPIGRAGTVSVTIFPPDAGTTLVSSRSSLGISLGQSALLTATYSVDGVPTPDAGVMLTTSLGALLLTDGGTFAPQQTDSAGQIRALLVESGTAGTANVVATGPMGRPGATSVNIFLPDAGVTISSNRTVLTVGFNEVAQIDVNHTVDGRVIPGRSLQLQTSAGRLLELDGGPFVSPGVTDLGGGLHALLTDTGSPGIANVSARDPLFNVSASVPVTLAQPDAGVFVTAAKNRLYVGVNDSTLVTARLVTNGTPAVGRNLQVTTNLGNLVYADGGAPFTGTGVTDGAGALPLELHEAGVDGLATVTATDPMSMRTGSANIEILRIGTIAYVSTTCAGTPCSVMGIRNSGFNTQATLRFTLRDSRTMPQPVAGVRVTFVLNNQPTGTVVTASAISDSQGNVDAVVTSGDSIGSFSVTATVIPGISASSPTIGVRGAKPSSKGFLFQCPKVNLPAYRAAMPPLVIPATCTIILVDRNNNPVGAGTTVQFLAEAGNIQNSAPTQAYVPPLGTNEGRGTVAFTTSGQFPAADVPPFTAAPAQFPFPRVMEPQRSDGSLTRNPRDGLVTLIAYTDGEEWFADSNSNGVRDGTEQFIDQGEPLVDVNDNDVWDMGENYIDVDGNMAWTPPNGVWNASTKIWTKTYVLYTDYGDVSLASFSPATFNVARGTSAAIDAFMTDRNRNILEATSTATMSRTGSKGTITFLSALGLDGYGFQIDPRRLTNAAGDGDCLGSEPVCQYRTVFGSWSAGPLGRITVNGAAPTDMTASENVTITISTTTLGLTAMPSVSGTVQ